MPVSFGSISHTRRLVSTRRKSQAGFTMSEVLVSLMVFTIAVVGLVAIESRSIEAHRASTELREGERLAQEVMSELMSISFDELVEVDFNNQPNPNFPYNDVDTDTWEVRDFRTRPTEDETVGGQRSNFYWVGRTVGAVPPVGWLSGDPNSLDALQLDVTVLWIDYTNPAFPPPATEIVDNLRPENIIPGDAQYKPWVSGVQLRTVRVNDGAPTQPDGSTGN
jgi:prepilin-type N-terminal cleavage/methylation domain-containing protein